MKRHAEPLRIELRSIPFAGLPPQMWLPAGATCKGSAPVNQLVYMLYLTQVDNIKLHPTTRVPSFFSPNIKFSRQHKRAVF